MIRKLSLAGIIPVIKIDDANDAVPLCKALADGGLPVAEITFRTASAEESIRRVHRELPGVLLGAGTVTTVAQVDLAVAAGASYIVSPGINAEVVRRCQSHAIPIVPGCANPSDIETALSLGVKTVKFFPAEALGGLKLLKALSGPYGEVTFVPTGGIGEQNMLDYLDFPKVVACGGSWMVDQKIVRAKDWAAVGAMTQSAVARLLQLEVLHVDVRAGVPDSALRDVRMLSGLLGWPVADAGLEPAKGSAEGACGSIAVGCRYLQRAKWHLERRGFAFEEQSAETDDGTQRAIYLKGEIAGFSVRLLQKPTLRN